MSINSFRIRRGGAIWLFGIVVACTSSSRNETTNDTSGGGSGAKASGGGGTGATGAMGAIGGTGATGATGAIGGISGGDSSTTGGMAGTGDVVGMGGAVIDSGPACESGACACPASCANHLLISEVQTRGSAGAEDAFVELYNPTGNSVALDSTWLLEFRGATQTGYATKWTGPNLPIAPHGHFLIVGSAYSQTTGSDSALTGAISDAGSLRLKHSGSLVDVVCFAYSAGSQTALSGAGFTCEGTPANNLPHTDNSTTPSNSNASIERKPGSTLGNCVDTDDNQSDFVNRTLAAPENVGSAPSAC